MRDIRSAGEAASAPASVRYPPYDRLPAETDDDWTGRAPPGVEFPGCTPYRLKASELDTYECRIEFWDSETETAWVCEPTSPYHERPGQALSALAERIAGVRGSPVTCYGSMDLLLRNVRGRPRRIMQADQSLYLHPLRAALPEAAMVIGEHDFPDVVLEVDHSTDVRRGKLGLYESWGFPEVWVQVPDKPAASRSRRRLAGLTIHVLKEGAFRVSGESLAFPGWTAEEIHTALDEATPSRATLRVLERVGRALGAREGTGPDDDLLQRSLRDERFEQGVEQGIEQGLRRALDGERERLCRLAARKFGEATGAELARLLASVADGDLLAAVGEHLIDCATGADLLDRVGVVPGVRG